MKTVTFASEYRHPLNDVTAVHYKAGRAYTVSNEIADAARKAGKLEEKPSAGPDDGASAGGDLDAEE